MSRVAVVGAKGRMGSLARRALAREPDLEVVAELGRGDDLRAALAASAAEIVLELTLPESAFGNARTALLAGCHVVVGASGLSADEVRALDAVAHAESRSALWVPNFSIGAVLMQRFAREAAQYLEGCEIVESHHPGKKDAPSATALETARQIAGVRASAPSGQAPAGRDDSEDRARGRLCHGVPVHSVRLPGLIAEQVVTFGAVGQTLAIRHVTYDREAFAPGIVLSLRRVAERTGCRVGLESVLDSSPGRGAGS